MRICPWFMSAQMAIWYRRTYRRWSRDCARGGNLRPRGIAIPRWDEERGKRRRVVRARSRTLRPMPRHFDYSADSSMQDRSIHSARTANGTKWRGYPLRGIPILGGAWPAAQSRETTGSRDAKKIVSSTRKTFPGTGFPRSSLD